MSGDRTPVTVIGGYLGAGKTTLINRLLTAEVGRRLAVLVNDFGSVNIDADLIASHDGETISLENGCVCCSIADSLGDALDTVLGLDPSPDQIVIEASGVADPAKIAHYGQGWPGCRLDAVVVLADATAIRKLADDQFVGELVARQLRSGDLTVLTKTDLVTEATVADVTRWVHEVTVRPAPVLAVADGRLDCRLVFDATVGRRDYGQSDPAIAAEEQSDPAIAAEEQFESVVIQLPPLISRERLEAALTAWPAQVVRVKGLATLANEGQHLVQRVGRRWSVEPLTRNVAGHDRLVLIGPRGALPVDRLRSALVETDQPVSGRPRTAG